MDNYNFFRKDGFVPSEEQCLLTKQFYQNSVEIYAHYNEWKDDDQFYFIPLYLEMTYSLGWVAEIAPDPVWMGSFVRCTLEHPDLFQSQCPKCGATIFPYRYVGSPLSGRVDLEGRCKCGWTGYESVSGWRLRAQTLRNQLASDQSRYKSFKRNSPGNKVTVDMLLAEIHHHLFSALSFLLELPL